MKNPSDLEGFMFYLSKTCFRNSSISSFCFSMIYIKKKIKPNKKVNTETNGSSLANEIVDTINNPMQITIEIIFILINLF